MRPAGFTLIELLVVISIIAVLSIVGFVNFKGFSQDQVTDKAVGQIQTYLRLAQSNATSQTLCNGQGAASWSLKFLTDAKTIELHCDPNDYLKNTYILENASFTITGAANCPISLPAILSYSSGAGTPNLSAGNPTTDTCLKSPTITFAVLNTKNPAALPRAFGVSKGGAINVKQ